MIFTEIYSNDNRFSFEQVTIDTDKKTITVDYGDNPRVISFVEIYSSIKQMYIKNEKLLMFPFPLDYLTESSITLTNGYLLYIL